MKKRTEIVVILDKSGSMRSHTLDVLTGFSKFLDSQKALEGDANVTLVQFNDRVYTIQPASSISTTLPMKVKDFIPRGRTALYDAIGKTIKTTAERLERTLTQDFIPAQVIVAIMTDGKENESKFFKLLDIVSAIKEKSRTYGWQFYFFAATKEAMIEGEKMGILPGNITLHDNTGEGFRLAYEKMDRITTQLRIEDKKGGSNEPILL